MFTKPISELTYSDIDDLVNIRKEREGYHLDFKREIGSDDKAKKELSKDISAFANTGGGYLVIGVDKDYKIVGVDKKIQNREIDEWINQVLNSNIEPAVFYFDPKIITIPESDKVIVLMQVPESTKKPHIVNEWNKYHIRINDSSKSANHNNIRDMFEFSKNRTDEFNDFLKKRNLGDPDDEFFGENKNAEKLVNDIGKVLNKPKPFVLFSFIPKYLNEEKIKLSVNEFNSWLQSKIKGYNPNPQMLIYNTGYQRDIKLDGIIFRKELNNEVWSYFDLLNNGFFEVGAAYPFLFKHAGQMDNIAKGGVNLTGIICYEMMLFGFAKEYYKLAKYYDEVFFQLSFVNVDGFELWGLHDTYRRMPFGNFFTNTQHKRFKLTYKFNPSKLTDDEIVQIASRHSEMICRAFNLDKDCAFVDNQLSRSELNQLYM